VRTPIPFLDADSLGWDGPPGGGVYSKILNSDPATNAKTMLLRSDPRPVTEQNRRRAHSHDGSEEFLSLGARFTFDAGLWLERLSYVHMPPRTVHGSDVQVPDGYLLYLRTTGATEPQFMQEPMQSYPFSLGSEKFTIIPDAVGAALSRDASLIRLQAGYSGTLPMESERCREVFVVEGEMTAGGHVFREHCYACYEPGDAPVLKVHAPTLLMVNLS
jgi:hypothetical protein